jgi:hypothetical protein
VRKGRYYKKSYLLGLVVLLDLIWLVERHASVTQLPKPFDLRSLRQTLEQLGQREVL